MFELAKRFSKETVKNLSLSAFVLSIFCLIVLGVCIFHLVTYDGPRAITDYEVVKIVGGVEYRATVDLKTEAWSWMRDFYSNIGAFMFFLCLLFFIVGLSIRDEYKNYEDIKQREEFYKNLSSRMSTLK